MTTRRTKSTAKRTAKSTSKNPLKNPKGGLTAAGREHFRATEGAHLKPGVQGKADTPEKMRRKGSFLRRHFAHPRGPMKDDQGKPTRLALSAHAWGEPVPKDMAAAKRLADKGTRLLERYQATKTKPASGTRKAGPHRATRGKTGAKTRTRTAASAKRSTARKSPARSKAKAPARRQKSTRRQTR